MAKLSSDFAKKFAMTTSHTGSRRSTDDGAILSAVRPALERIRERVRVLMDHYSDGRRREQRITQRAIAKHLKQSESDISRKLAGHYPFGLDDVDGIAEILGVFPAELLRGFDDPVYELAPDEQRIVREYRRLPLDLRDVVVYLVSALPSDSKGAVHAPSSRRPPPAVALVDPLTALDPKTFAAHVAKAVRAALAHAQRIGLEPTPTGPAPSRPRRVRRLSS